MVFTMVAVAIAGYLLVTAAPDFSNYAILSRSTGLDKALEDLRGAMVSQPHALTLTSTRDSEALSRLFEGLLVEDGEVVPPGAPLLPFVPRDPSFSSRDWYDSATNDRGPYWRVAFNMIRNPTFLTGSAAERRLEGLQHLTFLVEDELAPVPPASRSLSIWKCDTLGMNPGAVVGTPGFEYGDPRVSPDGSRVAYYRRGADRDGLYIASLAGAGETRITTVGAVDVPLWSPSGDLILYRKNSGVLRLATREPRAGAEGTETEFPIFGTVENIEAIGPATWSPGGGRIAYVVKLSRFQTPVLAVHDLSLRGDEFGDTEKAEIILASVGDYPATTVAPAWSPDGDELLYVSDTGRIRRLIDFRTGQPRPPDSAAGEGPAELRESGGTPGMPPDVVRWLPGPAQGPASDTSRWILVMRTTGTRKGIYRRRVDPRDESGSELPVVEYPVVGSEAMPSGAEPHLAVSPFGTRIAFGAGPSVYIVPLTAPPVAGVPREAPQSTDPSGTRRTVYRAGEGGPPGGLPPGTIVLTVPQARRVSRVSFTPLQGLDMRDTGTRPPVWNLPPAAARLVLSGRQNRLEENIWRSFLESNRNHPGDTRFGKRWLRISPPENQDKILFDNGENLYMIDRGRPAVLVRVPGQTTEEIISKRQEPAWGPEGSTYIARESESAVGDAPVNLFKNALGVPPPPPGSDSLAASAPTVRLSTGFEATLSPDGLLVALSSAQGPQTTFPPSRVGSRRDKANLDNVDIFVINSEGKAAPTPKNLTPNSEDSQERNPCWSPDGRYVYYQRETQDNTTFLANHNSSIWRVTVDGGVQSEIVVGGTLGRPWIPAGSSINSRVEPYEPRVSPDGTRLAFIGKERLLSEIPNFQGGDVISDILYVKDLLLDSEPVRLLHSPHPLHPQASSIGDASSEYAGWSFDSLSWNPTGEEILLVRYRQGTQGVVRFPAQSLEGDSDFDGDGIPYDQEIDADQDLIRVAVQPPTVSLSENFDILTTTRSGVTRRGSGDPVPRVHGGRLVPNRIYNAVYSPGGVVFQRVLSETADTGIRGVSLGDIWYVLSGYVRTSASVGSQHVAQMTVQVLDKQGLLVDQTDGEGVYQRGLVDLGGGDWVRYSAGLQFRQASGNEPYSFNILLYSLGRVGSSADFTGLQLERAFDEKILLPSRFGLGWIVSSSSKDPDPRVEDGMLFER